MKSYASEIKSWVYDLLGYDVHLSKEERSALGWIQSAAELASILMESGETIRLFQYSLSRQKIGARSHILSKRCSPKEWVTALIFYFAKIHLKKRNHADNGYRK